MPLDRNERREVLVDELTGLDQVEGVDPGIVDGSVWITTRTMGLTPEIMETLADNDYYVAKGFKETHQWVGVYDG